MEMFVLYTIINGRKNYVSNYMGNRSFDNKKIVNYTIHPEDAKDFGSADAAAQFIDNIVNPHERVFNADVVTVDAKKPVADTAMTDSLK
jgi:hypothetical protein